MIEKRGVGQDKFTEELEYSELFNVFLKNTEGKFYNNDFKSLTEFIEVTRTLITTIRDLWVETDGGVHVRGLGYFCVYMIPDKMYSPNKFFTYFDRLKTDGYAYVPTHFNDIAVPNKLYGFRIKFAKPSIIRSMYQEINKGRNYTRHNSIVKIINKRFTSLLKK